MGERLKAYLQHYGKILTLMLYIVFLFIWCLFLSFQQDPGSAHEVVEALDSVLLVPQVDATHTSLSGIANEGDVWNWLEKVLIPGLWQNSVYPTTTPTSILKQRPKKLEDGYVRKFNYGMGAIISQKRYVRSTSCLFDEIKLKCYKKTSQADADKKPDFTVPGVVRTSLQTAENNLTFTGEGNDFDLMGEDYMGFDYSMYVGLEGYYIPPGYGPYGGPYMPYGTGGSYSPYGSYGSYGGPPTPGMAPTPMSKKRSEGVPAPRLATAADKAEAARAHQERMVDAHRRRVADTQGGDDVALHEKAKREAFAYVKELARKEKRRKKRMALQDKDLGLTSAFSPTDVDFDAESGENVYLFYLDADYSLTEATTLLKLFRDYLWIDKETREVTVTVPVYNVNYGIFLKYEVKFQFTKGGKIRVDTDASFGKPLSDADPNFALVITFGILVLGATIALAVFQVIETGRLFAKTYRANPDVGKASRVRKSCVAVTANFWQITNLATVTLMVVTLILYGALTASTLDLVDQFAALLEGDTAESEVVTLVSSITSTANQNTAFLTVSAIATLVLFINGIRFFNVSPTMGLLSETLGRASKSLASFTFLFVFLFMAFAVMGHLSFGSTLAQFSTMWDSTVTASTLLFGAGEVTYTELKGASKVLAPVFFWLFFLMNVLVLTNVFIAILSEYYAVAKEHREAEAQKLKARMRGTILAATEKSKAEVAAAAAAADESGGGVPDLKLDGTEMKEVTASKKAGSRSKSPRGKSPRKKKINDILSGLDNDELKVDAVAEAPALPDEEEKKADE